MYFICAIKEYGGSEMKRASRKKYLIIKSLCISACLLLAVYANAVCSDDEIQFNTDILDIHDRNNIDLSRFSHGGYIMPGTYDMTIHVNKDTLPEQKISFFGHEGDQNNSYACISPALVEQLGFIADVQRQLFWRNQGACLDEASINGMVVRGDLATSSLYLSIPQSYLEYNDANWEPSSRWDNGISGFLFDYNINAYSPFQKKDSSRDYSISGNGTTGFNLGGWRLRADWQENFNRQNQFDWSRYYAYRALPALRSKLMLGEDYLKSDMFDSFPFTGMSVVSDDNMLPPNLRGYAPEVSGVAKTNARVVISQQGRVLYETTVAAGPFRIQDISSAVNGDLKVQVEEQDGSQQVFTVNTASIPYLTRPGQVRFKLATGKPLDGLHQQRGDVFATGEFSWGINNGWSLYSGVLSSRDYNAFSFGIGRDLMLLGAMSFDINQSRVWLPIERERLSGDSYRLSYSKSFDEYDSQVTFAGYRFSERDFMSMSEYLNARYYGTRNSNGKEMYTITFNKQFRELGLSSNINYSHETYWNHPNRDRYNLTLSRYFNIGRFRNLSLSLSAYRNEYDGSTDDGAYLSLSMPWGNNGTIGYNATVSKNDMNHGLSYYDHLDDRSTYQLSTGSSDNEVNVSGFYSHDGDLARISTNINYREGRYSAVGFSAEGGLTLTSEGGAMHRIGVAGGTRMLIDTQGIPDVPVRGYGYTSTTNSWGKAVVGDINSYYRNTVSIDLDKLDDKAEAIQSVAQATLTEGAIGYRHFDVISGAKAMVKIKLLNGSTPPFGATVVNASNQETGIINDGGTVYLSGIKAGEIMTVHWNDVSQCEIEMPKLLSVDMLIHALQLPCRTLRASIK